MGTQCQFNEATQQSINRFLQSSGKLAAFCTPNGSVDPETLHVDVLSHYQCWVIVAVEFMEVIDTDREDFLKPCFGRLELRLDNHAERVLEAYAL